jgi:hypothetical protein
MTDIHIKEFEKLKDEQISRAAHRDRLFHLTIILIGGGFTLAFTYKVISVLLLLPVVAFIAGMSHVACDRRISAIGSYFREVLAGKIAKTTGVPAEEIFTWEDYIREDPKRYVRKWLQLFTNFLLYVGSGGCALFWYLWHVIHTDKGTPGPLEWFGVFLGVVLMAMMLWQLTQHAFIRLPSEHDSISLSRAGRGLLRVAVSAVFAAGAFWLVLHYGPLLLPNINLGREVAHFEATGPVTLLTVAAACSAFLVWSIGVFSKRR